MFHNLPSPSSPSSMNKNGSGRGCTLATMQFAVAGVSIVRLAGVIVLGPSNMACTAWMAAGWPSCPSAIHRATTRRRRRVETLATSLRNAKCDGDGETKEKNYSPFRASWKTTGSEAAPKKNQTSGSFPKFEPPKIGMSMPEMPDLPKFEAPQIPTMPEMPSMPEFSMPKLEAPKLARPKFPDQAQGKISPTPPWADTNLQFKNRNTKTNYSPLKASWKTTTTTPSNTQKFPALPNMDMPKIDMPKMQIPKPKMPEMPPMPEFNVPKLEAPKLNRPMSPARAQGGGTPGPPLADANRNTKNHRGNTKTNYSPLKASWKATTPNPINTPKLPELPTVSLPDLSSLGLPDNVPIEQYSDEARRLSLQIDASIKDKVNAFTGQSHYKVGDITRAIIAKVANEEFELAEITFFFRVLIALGVDLSGISAVLPMSGLVGVLGWGVSMGLAERVTQFVVVEINKRVNDGAGATGASGASSATPNTPPADQYTPGDLTKSALLGYTGKSSYAVGDLAGRGGGVADENSSVLRELEECLSMEKELIEKLDRIQRQGK